MNGPKSLAAVVFMLSVFVGTICVYFAPEIGLTNFTVLGLAAFIGAKSSLFAFMFAKEA